MLLICYTDSSNGKEAAPMGDRQIRCGEFCKRISDIVEAKANKKHVCA